MYKNILLLVTIFLTTACVDKYSTLGDKIYLKSEDSKPLVVPKTLSQDNLSQDYIVPKVEGKKRVSIKPPV